MSYQHILAVVDNLSPSGHTLKKAAILASKSHARLTLLKVELSSRLGRWLPAFANPAKDTEFRHELDQLGHDYAARPLEVEVKYRRAQRLYRAVLDELQQADYDLVLLHHRHRHPLLNEFIGSDELHLLRESKAKLMFAGDSAWQSDGHMLIALQMDEHDSRHQAFNRYLLDEAQQLAQLLNVDIHLLNCYLDDNFGMSCRSEKTQEAADQQGRHWQALLQSAKPYHLAPEQLHLASGLADFLIPDMAERCGASLVVMGVEHSGLFSHLKGHTSEQVLNQLNCDLLAIKPGAEHSQSRA
ncbi:universal stress protein [Shewanella sp. AS16]|uniref:universal stress protein n=1 Tax=Shewanella sp. AS16 TaxID=2907625 RepID=UPI001F1D5D41|nr:universal stress protein [Shewanella sp. AS16]